MRVLVKKRVRYGITLIILIIAAAVGTFAYIEGDKYETREVEKVVLSYEIESDYSFKAGLIQNPVFYQKELGESNVLIRELIDDIRVYGSWIVETEEENLVEGHLKSYLYMVSYFGDDGEAIWERYKPLGHVRINGLGKTHVKAEDTFKMDVFDELMDQIYEMTGLEPDTELQIVWSFTGRIRNESVNLPFEHKYKLRMPLFQSVFKVFKEDVEEAFDQVVKTQTVEVKKNNIIYTYTALALSLLGVIWIAVTKSKPPSGNYDLIVNRIFREYSERLVQLEKGMSNQYTTLINMHDFRDLIKISDEIRQPIFYYRVHEGDGKKVEFYVFGEKQTYYLTYYAQSEVSLESFLEQPKRGDQDEKSNEVD